MKTLVTGATGFIGSNLVNVLSEKNRDVRCLVRQKSNISLLKNQGVEIVYGDLLDRLSLMKAVKNINIIYHLAGEVYSSNDEDCFRMNVQGTKNLLEACIKENTKLEKFTFFSSIAAFGPSLDRSGFLNESSACKPITSYGESKLEAQNLVLNYFRNYKIPTVVICLPLVYGQMDNPSSRVLTLFQKIKNQTFRIIGKGDNLISLCSIGNLMHYISIMEHKKNCIGKLYFVSDGPPLTFNEISQAIAEEMGSKIPHLHIPIWLATIAEKIISLLFKIPTPLKLRFQFNVKYLTSNWACDTSKAEKELELKPLFAFREELRKTIQWYLDKT